MDITKQNSINAEGKIIDKDRLTHNQSWKGKASGTSVNSHVIDSELQDCMFGFMLLQTIHYIISLQARHPLTRILIQKVDFKSAYRCCHLSLSSAIQTITQSLSLSIAFVALQLTFGGRLCSSSWCTISETVTDLANEILLCPKWDPSTLHSPL